MNFNSETTIFIVEDDASIRYGLEEVLKAEGFLIASCERGDEAISKIGESLPDVILLDVMLPGKNGYEICKELRTGGCQLPILMLTAKGQEIDKVIGLESGADDYITKPFGVQELLARVNAVLRRAARWSHQEAKNGGNPERTPVEKFTVGLAEIDLGNYGATIKGKEMVRLTPKEMELLKFFHRRQGQVLSRDDILDAVWGVQYYGTTRTLDQCVAQLRKKIGDTSGKPEFLETIHGVGYKLK